MQLRKILMLKYLHTLNTDENLDNHQDPDTFEEIPRRDSQPCRISVLNVKSHGGIGQQVQLLKREKANIEKEGGFSLIRVS